MIIDGKAIAADILRDVAAVTKAAEQTLRMGILTCQPGPETKQYLQLKKRKAAAVGIALSILELPESATTADCVASVKKLAEQNEGVIVQLPLPDTIDREQVLAAVPAEQDPDGFQYGVVEASILPPVVGAIDEIVRRQAIDLTDQRVVILGNGRLVGKPALQYVTEAGAQVQQLLPDSANYDAIVAAADVLITGIGQPHRITPEHVAEGVQVFDAGASEDGGLIVGDVHPEVAKKATLFTPVPGGIGPITVAVLLRNLVELSGIGSSNQAVKRQ